MAKMRLDGVCQCLKMGAPVSEAKKGGDAFTYAIN